MSPSMSNYIERSIIEEYVASKGDVLIFNYIKNYHRCIITFSHPIHEVPPLEHGIHTIFSITQSQLVRT
jgi:hypothetical protein